MSILVRVLLISVVFFLSSCQSDTKPSVTIYCAHDRVHAEQILDLFEAETGIMSMPFSTRRPIRR